jgi:hypothetical protein
MTIRSFLLSLALLASVPSAITAQALTTRAAAAADVESLDGIIDAFYDIVSHAPGQPVDWARDSTLYLRDLRFRVVQPGDSGARIAILDHAAFAAAQSDFSEGFVEQEIHRVTNRYGPMAQVFSTYEWRRAPGGPVGGRGINAIDLFHDGKRWWISSATWMQETDAHPIPEQYLPSR